MQSAGARDFGRAFLIGISLNLIYIVIEVLYGLSIDSLALVADAGHNLSDVLGLVLAWGAGYLVKKRATEKYTYGFKKSTVLAAFLNAMILLVAIGIIIWEAIGRISQPQQTTGEIIMIVAGIGVVINTATALLFYSGRKDDLNIKGAFLHMAADAAVSLGVVIVGLLLTFTDLYWLDPVVSIAIALVIFRGTWDLLIDSVGLVLDAVPKNIDKKGVEAYLRALPEVAGYHDLHIWAMSTTETALTVHVIITDINEQNRIIKTISETLSHQFNIGHTTIQIEDAGDEDCRQNPECT
jgi:cobalt-zinc-cadmium efflux system protein